MRPVAWHMTLSPMTTPVPLCVFSDLDGTLLDHASYDWHPARPALRKLAQIGAPVVLASSKTAAEIVPLQRDMGLTEYPAIVENGAGLVGLGAPDTSSGNDYDALRAQLAQAPHRYQFTGFADMTADEVAQVTGLSCKDATLAKERAFSEPGLWHGSDTARSAFLSYLAAQGINARQGGRFLTLSFGATKAAGMSKVIAQYSPAHTIALGDAPNDTEMLNAADSGIIIPNPHGTPLPPLAGESTGTITRAHLPGPAGWNAAILALLTSLGLMTESPTNG